VKKDTYVAVGLRDDGVYVVFAEGTTEENYGGFKRRTMKRLPIRRDFEVMSRAWCRREHPAELELWDEKRSKQ
jgi:hypothetical protein